MNKKRKGLYTKKEHNKPASLTRRVMGWGLALTGIGIVLFLSAFWTTNPDMWIAGTFFGFIGAAMLVFYKVKSG